MLTTLARANCDMTQRGLLGIENLLVSFVIYHHLKFTNLMTFMQVGNAILRAKTYTTKEHEHLNASAFPSRAVLLH